MHRISGPRGEAILTRKLDDPGADLATPPSDAPSGHTPHYTRRGESRMTRHRFIRVWALLPVLAGALLLALAAPAAAQSEVCVHLQVGSSFTATMEAIAVDGTTIGPSGSFAAGHTQCLKLDSIGDSVAFTVSVQAISGGARTATPRASRARPISQHQSRSTPVQPPRTSTAPRPPPRPLTGYVRVPVLVRTGPCPALPPQASRPAHKVV